MRLALASKLFELGQISSGQASDLIPMNHCISLKSLHQAGVSALGWDEDEFADEIANA